MKKHMGWVDGVDFVKPNKLKTKKYVSIFIFELVISY